MYLLTYDPCIYLLMINVFTYFWCLILSSCRSCVENHLSKSTSSNKSKADSPTALYTEITSIMCIVMIIHVIETIIKDNEFDSPASFLRMATISSGSHGFWTACTISRTTGVNDVRNSLNIVRYRTSELGCNKILQLNTGLQCFKRSIKCSKRL